MWVLEARKDAEKVWFPVVWEEKKDPSDVVDYDIRDEITIDTSSVFNANNDTTTGMATAIPWVNTNKLKLSTSIYIDKLEIPSVNQKLYWEWAPVNRPSETTTSIRNMTVQDSYGNNEITYYADSRWILYSWMKIPVAWYYQLYARYSWTSSSYWWIYKRATPKWWWANDTIWHTYTTWYSSWYKYETITRYFDKWELFYLTVIMDRTSSTPIEVKPTLLIEAKKL